MLGRSQVQSQHTPAHHRWQSILNKDLHCQICLLRIIFHHVCQAVGNQLKTQTWCLMLQFLSVFHCLFFMDLQWCIYLSVSTRMGTSQCLWQDRGGTHHAWGYGWWGGGGQDIGPYTSDAIHFWSNKIPLTPQYIPDPRECVVFVRVGHRTNRVQVFRKHWDSCAYRRGASIGEYLDRKWFTNACSWQWLYHILTVNTSLSSCISCLHCLKTDWGLSKLSVYVALPWSVWGHPPGWYCTRCSCKDRTWWNILVNYS